MFHGTSDPQKGAEYTSIIRKYLYLVSLKTINMLMPIMPSLLSVNYYLKLSMYGVGILTTPTALINKKP
jgi:hypothetical protein